MLQKEKEFVFRGIKNNSFFTLFLRLAGILFIFLTTYIFTNNYNSEIVGLYDFTRSYFLVFGSIIMLSSDQTILYLIGRYNNSKESIIDIYKKILIFCLILFVFNNMAFIGFISLNFFLINETTKEIILKTNLVLFFYCIFLINIEIIRALGFTFLSETFRNVIKYLPLIIGFVFLNDSNNPYLILDFFIYGFVIISIISFVLLWFFLKKHKTISEDYKKDTFKEIIKYSLPITLSTVSLYLLSSIDIFFLKYFYGDNYVAYYSVAIKIISIISVAINALSLSVATDIAYNFKNNNFSILKTILNKTAKIIFYFSFVLTILILMFSNSILNVFGKEYLISKEILIILLLGNLIMAISGNTYIYLLMTNKGKILGRLIFISVLINVILNFILIPKYCLYGAAISSVIALLFWNFMGSLYVYKKDRINILFKF